tara:strand:+ start:2515 stop:3072 length:558 start_codon:yes stop_codon:yes gene_type:complete
MGFPIFNFNEYKSIFKILSTPREIHENIWDIDLAKIKEKGYDTFVLDVDNTILSNFQINLSLQHLNWIQKCKDSGFKVYILSNNRSRKRIQRVCEQINTHGYFMAIKPFPYTLKRLSKEFNFSLKKTVVVGDQVLKDIFLANWVKSYSVLVKPIDSEGSYFGKLQRRFEEYLLMLFSVKIPFKQS